MSSTLIAEIAFHFPNSTIHTGVRWLTRFETQFYRHRNQLISVNLYATSETNGRFAQYKCAEHTFAIIVEIILNWKSFTWLFFCIGSHSDGFRLLSLVAKPLPHLYRYVLILARLVSAAAAAAHIHLHWLQCLVNVCVLAAWYTFTYKNSECR